LLLLVMPILLPLRRWLPALLMLLLLLLLLQHRRWQRLHLLPRWCCLLLLLLLLVGGSPHARQQPQLAAGPLQTTRPCQHPSLPLLLLPRVHGYCWLSGSSSASKCRRPPDQQRLPEGLQQRHVLLDCC
jgi:hypothetical protein